MSKQQGAQFLGPQQREAAWEQLQTEQFDVVVVGGGVVGVGAALDAATRGLKVALVEARDYASGTSSRSSKMFHGGLRYLEQLEFGLVREALRERELSLTTLAPHLVKPLKFLFPLAHRVWERPYMAAGIFLYDRMGGAKSVPSQKHLTRAGALRMSPSLKRSSLTGGIQYYDTVVDDARHTMTVARTAAHYGAVVRTSTQVVAMLREGARDASGQPPRPLAIKLLAAVRNALNEAVSHYGAVWHLNCHSMPAISAGSARGAADVTDPTGEP